MGKTFIFFSLLLLTVGASAQTKLSESRTSSYYTLIYRLSTQQATEFYNGKVDFLDQLVNPIDSFITDKGDYRKYLEPGVYLDVFASESSLKYRLREYRNTSLNLFENNDGLAFTIHDRNGDLLTAAQVYLNGRKLKSGQGGIYRKKHFKKESVIRIDHNEVVNFFPVTKRENHFYDSGINWQNTWHYLKYRSPFAWAYKKIAVLFPGKDDDNPGFIAFNRPIYKPGDTVKLKAFLFGKRIHSPIWKKDLYLRLLANPKAIGLGKLKPYRKGAYETSFVLHDSMELKLDNYYTVSLTSEKDVRKSKTNLSSSFKYEDYELESIAFSMRADKEEFAPNNPLSVYFKAVDENNLAVPDGRVTLNVLTSTVHEFKDSNSFIPDTILSREIKLDPIGETKFVLSDSLMPNAGLNIRLDAKFLNSDNEKQDASADVRYILEYKNIHSTLKNDSLFLEYRKDGKSYPKNVSIISTDTNGDTITNRSAELPASIKISQAAEDYAISYDGRTEWIYLENFQHELNVFGHRTSDSISINVSNPRKLFFSYSLYSGNRLIKEGSGNKLEFAKKYKSNKALTCIINFIWAGESMKIEQALILNKRELNMVAEQPLDVYPGKESDIIIKVTDYKGAPVADADITAYAYTSKFKNARPPNVPSFSKANKGLKYDEGLDLDDAPTSGSEKLIWDRWAGALGLDSIAYFKFTHPKDTIQFFENTLDGTTQLAPFAISKGEILPIHFLYIDNLPVYSSQSDIINRYSFPVSVAKHSVKIRTLKGEFIINDIQAIEGHKLTLAINVDDPDNNLVRKTVMPDTLTRRESQVLSKYFLRVIDNFGNNMAYLRQDGKVFLFAKNAPYSPKNKALLAGPLKSIATNFALTDRSLSRNFLAESGFSYEFRPNLIRQKSLSSPYPFSTRLVNTRFSDRYKDVALQRQDVERIWETFIDLQAHSRDWFNSLRAPVPGSGKLTLKLKPDSIHKTTIIRNIIITRDDDLDFIRILPGNNFESGDYPPGKYRILVLLANDEYLVFDKIDVKPFGINYIELPIMNPQKSGLSEQKIWRRIKEVIIGNTNGSKGAEYKVKQSVNDKFIDISKYQNAIQGRVLSKSGDPLPGVSVKVYGTNHGTFTDVEGKFSMLAPVYGKLVVTFIGFQTAEVNISESRKIVLEEQSDQLEEVVVVAYGVEKRSLSYALSGHVAGIMIRGSSGTRESNPPLIIVNGLPFDGDINDIAPSDIKEMHVLKADEAIAIYGSRALGGVILITTQGKNPQMELAADAMVASSGNLRRNFSDDAFWEPRLITDEKGEAKFKVTFPDDITNWKTIAIGVNKKMTGVSEQSIRSFKTLSANIALPQFSIDGDRFNILGKILSYTPLEVSVQRSFKLNDKVINTAAFAFKNSFIDTFMVNSNDLKDSIRAEYSIRLDNGYFDGELRSIPIYKAGLVETKGVFESLTNDTTLSFSFDPKYGSVKFNAVASLLPVLEEEFNYLRNYEYLCNEQMASKLIGLLAERNLRSIQKETFKEQKQIRYLIKRLLDNQRQAGAWGWWLNSEEEYWISKHVIDALLQAEEAGFPLALDKEKVIDRLVFTFNSVNNSDKIQLLDLLRRLNAKVDFSLYSQMIEKDFNTKTSVYDRLRLLKIKQEIGENVSVDSVLKTHKKTMLGNIYFGEINNQFFDNAVQNSVLVYNILKRSNNKYPAELVSLRNFFLEQRSTGRWRNTYETALILNAIVPDIIKEGSGAAQPVIQLNGIVNEVVDQFPYTTNFDPTNSLSLVKSGKLPVYVTAFQQFWNKDAAKESNDFEVTTYFKNKYGRVDSLTAGEEVELIVEVTPRADADYVQIEVPIPAGCSYESKGSTSRGQTEVHREHFKNKVSIFCNTLKPRKYEFSIKLIPRYGGTYILNPAKVEMMYFPTFFGREGMKKVTIN